MENPTKIINFHKKKEGVTETDQEKLNKFLQKNSPTTEELTAQKEEADIDYLSRLRRARPDFEIIKGAKK